MAVYLSRFPGQKNNNTFLKRQEKCFVWLWYYLVEIHYGRATNFEFFTFHLGITIHLRKISSCILPWGPRRQDGEKMVTEFVLFEIIERGFVKTSK